MHRRPWPIVIFAFYQVCIEPIANILVSAWLSDLSVTTYLQALFASKQWVSIFYMLALPVIMGVAVYAVKKWSYSIFVAGSTWILVRNFATYHDSQINLGLAVSFYLLNLGFVSYFVIPAVRRQYFDARVRWWETATRYLVNFGARFEHEEKSDSCEIKDISTGGVFAYLPTQIDSQELIRLRFTPNGRHIFSIKAKVVFHRQAPGQSGGQSGVETRFGHGLQFVEVSSATQQMLNELIRELKSSGCASRDAAGSPWEDFKKWSHRLVTTGKGLLPTYPQLPTLGATADAVTAKRQASQNQDQAA